MKFQEFGNRSGFRKFIQVRKEIYRDFSLARGTDEGVEKLLILGPSTFHRHATVKAFLVVDGQTLIGRFALIHDRRLPEFAQIAFFEIKDGVANILSDIKDLIFNHFPQCSKVLVGLNGHLNYGAGILTDQFDKPPIFGLPYSPPYYPEYFKDWDEKRLFSYRILVEDYVKWSNSYSKKPDYETIKARYLDKKNLERDIRIYTELNNKGFTQHPYWADRDAEEDMELFYPFRFFLDNEHLVFAEVDGQPVGFFLWYPDFNQLPKSNRDLNIYDLLRYRLWNGIDTCRFTEIGILPEYRGTSVALSMIEKAIPAIVHGGYKYCEIGFIFEENRASIIFLKRFLERFGLEPIPYKQYAVYEDTL